MLVIPKLRVYFADLVPQLYIFWVMDFLLLAETNEFNIVQDWGEQLVVQLLWVMTIIRISLPTYLDRILVTVFPALLSFRLTATAIGTWTIKLMVADVSVGYMRLPHQL